METASKELVTPTELAKSYDHAAVQKEVSACWDELRLWHTEPDQTKPSFVICIPPPNVTAALHLGHAFNNTLQDILVRWKRMAGFNSVWLPGTDHAGIATQTVVEKRVLREEGKRRTEFTREAFVARIQTWKDEYEARILSQLKSMACSCDWDRVAFTMDAPRSLAVRTAFFQLFKDKLIYRGKRLVNWDPVTLTALADDEVENEEIDGFFYYLRYPVEGGGFVTVATTRPETMLGDTAVAVNPKDPRAASLAGKRVLLPIVGRSIPIIADEYVVLPVEFGGDENDAKSKFSSGFLKVTPAHDENDYKLGEKHSLPRINVMAPNADISLDHGWAEIEPQQRSNTTLAQFLGLSREEARKAVVAWFKQNNLLEKVVPYRHSVGHSYRSHVPVEPYLSDQWYVAVQKQIPGRSQSLAGLALSALTLMEDGKSLSFIPDRYAKTFETWNANLRDWCISRQLWWGHRIPVWQLPEGKSVSIERLNLLFDSGVITGDSTCVCVAPNQSDVEREIESMGFVQDADVLDTWFSSALWPMSTLKWPEKSPEMAAWNPTDTLCTSREIITLWVSRMVMFNRYLLECEGTPRRLPFNDVLVHAMIQDGHGQKMSKSLGNGVDPLDIIETHGTDAMRFTLCHMATQSQDARLPVDCLDPFTGEAFTPPFITNSAGYNVAQPVVERGGKKFATSYGSISGEAPAEFIVAKNTSTKFDLGRNFANKLWNAARFVFMQIKGTTPVVDETKWSSVDRWILSRLARTIEACNQSLADYRYDQYARAVYDFVWRDFCDWYLEAAKPAMRDANRRDATALVLATCLDQALRLLHPVMPLITERLWWALNEICPSRGIDSRFLCASSERLMNASWPTTIGGIDAASERIIEQMQEIIVAVRELRNSAKADPKKKVLVTIIPSGDLSSESLAGQILENRAFIELLAVCEIKAVGAGVAEPESASKTSAANCGIYVEGLIDSGSSEKRKADLAKAIASLKGRLSNEGYIARAPAKLVDETRQQLASAEEELAKLGG